MKADRLHATDGAERARTRGPVFFLGTGNPAWLKRAGVPLFVSDTQLRKYKTLPRAIAPWALDSGGFTQLQRHGRWTLSIAEYVERVRRYRDQIRLLQWVAPMDEMCEPAIIHGGRFGGQQFVGTRQFIDPAHRLTDDELVRIHQRNTVANFDALRAHAPDLPVIPVLQGYREDHYVRCIAFYRDAGVDLTREPLVGLGSVCRRQNSDEIDRIVTAVRDHGVRRLHGFGVKTLGLRRYGHLLTSVDSQAWSRALRYHGRPVCGQPHPRGAKNCANCLPAALAWRHRLLTDLATARRIADRADQSFHQRVPRQSHPPVAARRHAHQPSTVRTGRLGTVRARGHRGSG